MENRRPSKQHTTVDVELSQVCHCRYELRKIQKLDISLESSEDVGMGAILGRANNHIKAFMLHPLKDQRGQLIEGP